MARTVFARRPIHCLGADVYRAHERDVARGAQKDAAARLAASVHRGPTVHVRNVEHRKDQQHCDECERSAGEQSLYDVRGEGPGIRVTRIKEAQRSENDHRKNDRADDIEEDDPAHNSQYMPIKGGNGYVRAQWNVSPFATIAIMILLLFSRVSGLFAVWSR